MIEACRGALAQLQERVPPLLTKLGLPTKVAPLPWMMRVSLIGEMLIVSAARLLLA